MQDCIIGDSGFVGSTLLRQTRFDARYRSSNIAEIDGKHYGTLVCAGAPAQKWLANREPAADLRNIQNLTSRLETVRCETFILVSTVDVFKVPIEVDEYTVVEETGLHAYGLHRRLLEKYVESHFQNHLIVRLPGLVGPGLRKNVVFDLLNANGLQSIESRGIFQFYPTVNLWYDIQIALQRALKLVHLTAEPISVSEVAAHGFNAPFDQTLAGTPARYDMRTRFAEAFGGTGPYQYSRRDSLQAIRAYAQSEPRARGPGEAIGQ